MKPGFVVIAAGIVAIAAASLGRSEPPGRSADVHRPLSQVNQAVMEYFAPGSLHDFQIVSQSRTRSDAEIVARRTVRDNAESN